MHSPRLLNALVVVLSLSSTQAFLFDSRLFGRSGSDVERRQGGLLDPVTPTDSSSGPTKTSDPPPDTTTSDPPTNKPTTTSDKPPTTSDQPTDTGSGPTNKPTTTTGGGPPPKTTSKPPTTTKPPPPPSTITHVVTQTNDQGQPTTFTSKSTSAPTAGLQGDGNGGGDNGNSGMDTKTRNIVIGVVVGVGGAIVLAGLGYVIWRVWGRKKGSNDPDDLIDYGAGYHPVEKTDAAAAGPVRSPFQSTLESYHAPTNVNQASNF